MTPRIHLLLTIFLMTSCLLDWSSKFSVTLLCMSPLKISECLQRTATCTCTCVCICTGSVNTQLHKSHAQQDSSTNQATSQADSNSELEPQAPDSIKSAHEPMPVHQENRPDHQVVSELKSPGDPDIELPPEETNQFVLQDVPHKQKDIDEVNSAAVSSKEGEPEVDNVPEIQDDSTKLDNEREGSGLPEEHHHQQHEDPQQEEQEGVQQEESNGVGSNDIGEDEGGAVTTAAEELDDLQGMNSVGNQQEISEMRTGGAVESDAATDEGDESEVIGGANEQDLQQGDPDMVVDRTPAGEDRSGGEDEGNGGGIEDRKTDKEPKEGTYY